MESQCEVVVIGNAGVDSNVYLAEDAVDFTVESIFTKNVDYIGQAGGYSARGFAQLGKSTAFIGYVGDDHNGRLIREALSSDRIDLRGLFIDPEGTARSINFVYPNGRRKNFYDGKGHMTLRPDLDICREVLSRGRLAHFNLPNWARTLLPLAKDLGLTISCDLQDIVTVDDPYRQDFIQYADILFFSGVNFKDPRPLIETFLVNRPEQIILVGLGAAGCALGTKDGICFFPAVDLPEPVIDTNGAGDGLAVGFLTSYVLDGFSLVDAVCRAQITARHTCTQRASSSSLITPELLDYYFRELSSCSN